MQLLGICLQKSCTFLYSSLIAKFKCLKTKFILYLFSSISFWLSCSSVQLSHLRKDTPKQLEKFIIVSSTHLNWQTTTLYLILTTTTTCQNLTWANTLGCRLRSHVLDCKNWLGLACRLSGHVLHCNNWPGLTHLPAGSVVIC